MIMKEYVVIQQFLWSDQLTWQQDVWSELIIDLDPVYMEDNNEVLIIVVQCSTDPCGHIII